MYQIDNSSASSTQPGSTSPGTPGFFTDGNPAAGVAATILPAEWLNAVQQEIINAIEAAGLTPNKASFTQLTAAIRALAYAPWNSANTYGIDSIVQRSDGTGGWISTVANNTNNPEAATDALRAGWMPFGGSSAPTSIALTTGTVTLTPLQAANPLIAFTGTLTGAVTIVVPNWPGYQWRFVSQLASTATGYAVSVKTATGTALGLFNTQNGTPSPFVQDCFVAASAAVTAINASGALLKTTVYPAHGGNTFTPDPRAKMTRVRACGGGGASGNPTTTGASQCSVTPCGANAAAGEILITQPITGTVAVVVGAGGTASAINGGTGGAGATTTFGSFASFPGGNGSTTSAPAAAPYAKSATTPGSNVTVSSAAMILWSIPQNIGNGGALAISNNLFTSGAGVSAFGGGSAGAGTGGIGIGIGPSTTFVLGNAGNDGMMIVEEYS